MARRKLSRNRQPGLLSRPPDVGPQDGYAALLIDPVGQLERLHSLYDQGILSVEEFESQKKRILAP